MEKDLRQVWKNCLAIIRDNVNISTYNTWFKPIKPLSLKGNVLKIQVPSPFFYEYLEEHFLDLLKKAIKSQVGSNAKLEYAIVVDTSFKNNQTLNLPGKNVPEERKKAGVTIPINNKGSINPFAIPGIKKMEIDANLNPQNSFDNFIEGECNRLAKNAGLTIAKNPGRNAFNPLLIYGDSGYGKTHLAQAIGWEVLKKFSDKVVLYIEANQFETQFTQSVRNNNRNDFIHFYQQIDVLIIDDVHEFSGKQATQDVFFHIFNRLHQSGKQLILTSDRPPVELEGLNRRLLSRFKWGLSTELTAPDYNTRLEILRKKMYNDGSQIDEKVLEYIARNVTTNIRELEGALISVLAHSLVYPEITVEVAKKVLSKIISKQKRDITINYIIKVVTDYFKIDDQVLQSKSRKREIVQARQIAMYLAKKYTNLSLSSIGAEIGKKDHSTVLHAVKTVEDLIQTDKNFKHYIEDICNKLNML